MAVAPTCAQKFATSEAADAVRDQRIAALEAAVTPTPTPTPTVSLAAANFTATEGDPGIDFVIARTGGTTSPATVPWTITLGSAGQADLANGQALTGTVTIPIGQTGVTQRIGIADDATPESTETFTFTITPPTGYNAGSPMSATGTILDNDQSPGAAPQLTSASSYNQPVGTTTYRRMTADQPVTFAKRTGGDAAAFVLDADTGVAYLDPTAATTQRAYTLPYRLTSIASGLTTDGTLTITAGAALEATASLGISKAYAFTGAAGTLLSSIPDWVRVPVGRDTNGSQDDATLDGNGHLDVSTLEPRGANGKGGLGFSMGDTCRGLNLTVTAKRKDYSGSIDLGAYYATISFGSDPADPVPSGNGYRWNISAAMSNGVQTGWTMQIFGPNNYVSDVVQNIPMQAGEFMPFNLRVSADGTKVTIATLSAVAGSQPVSQTFTLPSAMPTTNAGFVGFLGQIYNLRTNQMAFDEINASIAVGSLAITSLDRLVAGNLIKVKGTYTGKKPSRLLHKIDGSGANVLGDSAFAGDDTSGTFEYLASLPDGASHTLQIAKYNDTSASVLSLVVAGLLKKATKPKFGGNDEKARYYFGFPASNDFCIYGDLSPNRFAFPYKGVLPGDYEITAANAGCTITGSIDNLASVVVKSSNPSTRKSVITVADENTTDTRGWTWTGSDPGWFTAKPLFTTDEVNSGWVGAHPDQPFMRDLNQGGANLVPVPIGYGALPSDTYIPPVRVTENGSTRYGGEPWSSQAKMMKALVSARGKRGLHWHVLPADVSDATVQANLEAYRDDPNYPANCDIGLQLGNEDIGFAPGGVGNGGQTYMIMQGLRAGLHGDGSQAAIPDTANVGYVVAGTSTLTFAVASGKTIIGNVDGVGFVLLRAKQAAPVGTVISLNNATWETLYNGAALMAGMCSWHANRLMQIRAIAMSVFGSAYYSRIKILLMGLNNGDPSQFQYHVANTAFWAEMKKNGAIGVDGYLYFDNSQGYNQTNNTPEGYAATLRAAGNQRVEQFITMARWVLQQGIEWMSYETSIHTSWHVNGVTAQYRSNVLATYRSDLGRQLEYENTMLLGLVPGTHMQFQSIGTEWGLLEYSTQDPATAPRMVGYKQAIAALAAAA